MSWRLGCLVVTALAVWQAHAKPLIEDATFSDVDLVAEDSFANAVYVAAPTRLKRTPQHFGSNCGFNGCGGRNIFGSYNSPAYNNYAYTPYNNGVQPPATVVNHVHRQQGPPPPIIQPQQQYRPAQAPAIIVSHQHQPSTGTVVRHEHQRNGPPPPSSFLSVHHDYEYASIPPQPPVSSAWQTPLDYYDYNSNEYSSGFHNHLPPGFHGGNPFGPLYGAPPGFNRLPSHYGPLGHGPPGHGPPGHGPPGHGSPGHFGPPDHFGLSGDFGPPGRGPPNYEGPPGYDNGPPPPPPPADPSAPQPTSPALPQPTKTPRPPASTQLTIAPVPSTTAAPVLVTMAPTTSTTTTTTTAEPFYDIDVRFGN